jgi:hypothetical protein
MRYHFKAKSKSLICVRQERMASEGTAEYHFHNYPVVFASLAELTEWFQKWYR